MKSNKFKPIVILLFPTLLSCHNDDPSINYDKLIIGQWIETNAIDSFTDYTNPSNNEQIVVTNESYSLTFTADQKFTLSETTENLDNGEYYFSDSKKNKYLNTHSTDNIRIPKVFNVPTIHSTYQISEITKNKLVLKSIILDTKDINGNLLSRREFIWELARQ